MNLGVIDWRENDVDLKGLETVLESDRRFDDVRGDPTTAAMDMMVIADGDGGFGGGGKVEREENVNLFSSRKEF